MFCALVDDSKMEQMTGRDRDGLMLLINNNDPLIKKRETNVMARNSLVSGERMNSLTVVFQGGRECHPLISEDASEDVKQEDPDWEK